MILYRPSYIRAFKKLSPEQQARVNLAIAKLEESFGRPHLHAGIGLRPFGGYFEFRAGLDLRILFVAHGGDLVLVTVGNHNAIRAFIRGN
jgi:hypothetical protein